MNAQVIQKKDSEGLNNQASNRVEDPTYRKRMIQVYQDEIQAFKEMKQEEMNGDRDNNRIKWINKQIKRCRNEIEDLEGVKQ